MTFKIDQRYMSNRISTLQRSLYCNTLVSVQMVHCALERVNVISCSNSVSRDANFSICQVVMIAEGNRRMPKAFVGGGYGRGASPLSLWGGLGVLHQDFFKNYMLFGAFWSNLSTNLKPYGYMIFHNKIQIFLHCPHIYSL